MTLAAKPGHLPGLEQSGRFLREQLGYETELLSREDMGREIGSTRYHGALLDPGGCSLQPAKYVQGLGAGRRAGRRAPGWRTPRSPGSAGCRAASRWRPLAGCCGRGRCWRPPTATPLAALGRLRRRVIPIGSYRSPPVPLDEELARRLVPEGPGDQ